MKNYIIKNYQEGFIEDQVKIGDEVSKQWQLFGQSNAERLKEVYSQPDFDPETRLYCFDEKKMVGFLTSAIIPEKENEKTIGNLSLPFVLEGYQGVTELLINKAITILKSKGAEIIRTFANDTWGKHRETAEKLGFKLIRDTAYMVGVKVNDLTIKEETKNVLEYNKERDLEDLVQIFIENLGMTEEQAKQNFEVIENSEEVIGHYVIRDDEKIVARTYIAKNNDSPELYVGYIYSLDDKYRNQLISKAIEVCKEKGIDEIRAVLFGGMVSKLKEYEDMGFRKLNASSMYEKEA